MEPRVRYAKTVDGVRVAFSTTGDGPPLLFLFPYHMNHLELNCAVPLHATALARLSRSLRVIVVDLRGAGLSDHDVKEVSLGAFVEDLRAVLSDLEVDVVAICAVGDAALVALRFAVEEPERVGSIVLMQSGRSEANRRLLNLRHLSPAVEGLLRGAILASDRENSDALAKVARNAVHGELLSQWEDLVKQYDAAALVREVTAPLVFIHADEDELVPLADAEALVAASNGGRLRRVRGRSGTDIWRDGATVEEITRFVFDGFGVPDSAPARSRRRTAEESVAGLSHREIDVLRRVAEGKTNQQIADELFVSVNTVAYHLRNILGKTGAANRTEAAAFAHRHGLR